MTKRQIELLIESVAYHHLLLQKMYVQQTDKEVKHHLEYEHEELCQISKILIKELDDYENDNF